MYLDTECNIKKIIDHKDNKIKNIYNIIRQMVINIIKRNEN